MQKLKFIYQNWNREYYELQSEEDTCSYYKNFYKGKEFKILPQILAENTKIFCRPNEVRKLFFKDT